MLAFFRALGREGQLLTRLPGLPIAFLIAEFFYKFKSFALECGAFLVTWAVVDVLAEALTKLFAQQPTPAPATPLRSMPGAAGGSHASQAQEARSQEEV